MRKNVRCPNEMVPLQIDLAIGDRRYLFGRSVNPSVRKPAAAGEFDGTLSVELGHGGPAKTMGSTASPVPGDALPSAKTSTTPATSPITWDCG